MTNEQKAYLAGIVDGEGSIYIGKTTTRIRPVYQMQLAVEITDRQVTDMFLTLVGGSVRMRKRSNSTKTIYAWVCCGKTATAFLEQVMPYLLIKKSRALLAIEFHKSILNQPSRLISPDNLISRENYYQNMRLLNA